MGIRPAIEKVRVGKITAWVLYGVIKRSLSRKYDDGAELLWGDGWYDDAIVGL